MKKFRLTRLAIFSTVLLALMACSDSKDTVDEEFVQTAHLVKGKVEKGPLVSGSTVEMRTLDKSLVATGESFTSNIENNAGDFNYGSLKVSSPYAKLTADGYFFNEVSGNLSTSTIKLNAFVDLTDNTTINVNVLTHLKSQRVNHLVTNEGKTFKEANEQAQEELLTQFGLQKYASKDASQFGITSGDDAAGALIAVSSLILSDRSEAEIVEYLSKLTTEFGNTGKFSDDTKERLKKTRNYLNGNLDKIRQNIIDRYSELGYNVTVKDLAFYFDWDDDGIAGNEIDGSSSVELSQSTIEVPAEGGDYEITIKSSAPYYLEAPSTTSGSDSGLDVVNPGYTTDETYFQSLYEGDFTESGIGYTRTISNNVVSIHVNAAQFRKDKEISIPLYNARGFNVASITLKQKGNLNASVSVPKLGEAGKSAVAQIMYNFAYSYGFERQLEHDYVSSLSPYTSGSSTIEKCWTYFYKAISTINLVRQADAQELSVYQDYLNTYLALAYYTLSSHWANVPFVTEVNSDYSPAPREEAEALSTIASWLEDAILMLDEKKNDAFSDANSMLFVSKDVARVVLAYVYANQKQFGKALPLLEKVISNGYYSLVNTTSTAFSNNSECILGFESSDISFRPCLDYKEVLLTAAECEYNLGNQNKAKAYLDEVCKAKSISTTESNTIKAIAEVRNHLQLPNYLTFLRRNNLGKSYLGLSDTYTLLWPIPIQELYTNPKLSQNPGY